MTIIEIRDRLVNDEIDYNEAFEKIKKLPKAWHSKEWVEKRGKIIKSKCEQCKNAEGVMVAQHLTHPDDFKTIRNGLFNDLFSEFMKSTQLPEPIITDNEIKAFLEETTETREACPNCKWINIRKRKVKRPEYFCAFCKIDFDEAITIEYNETFKTVSPTEEQVKLYLIDKMEKETVLNLRRKLYAENEKLLGKKALLISIDFHFKYVELENVLTFCKRCAAKMDLEHKLLCWTCKTNYFNYLFYDGCYNCYERNGITKSPIKELIVKYIKDDSNYRQQDIGND